MKPWVKDSIAIGCFFIVIAIFFLPLFYPVKQLIVTPDFGRSDAWHLSFSGKVLLAHSLKQNQLPLWTPLVGNGFPLFSEGQIGALYLPNLLLYRFLDIVTAYNLSFVISYVFAAIGLYTWARMLRLSRPVAWYGGITYAFSGIMMTHLTHPMIVSGLAVFPWIMVATQMMTRQHSIVSIGFLAFLVAQLVFIGFPQTILITLMCSGGYLLLLVLWRRASRRAIAAYFFAILLALLIGAIQILPSKEFLDQTSAKTGFDPQAASYFSFPLKHVITLLQPYILGNPRLGTYPPFVENGSIFWENTAYIGLAPLIFLIGLFIKKKKQHVSIVTGSWITLITSLLLMWGRHSPLYLVYSVWPMTLFRVPSRFIWPFTLSLIMLSSVGLERLWQKSTRPTLRLLMLSAITANTVLLGVTWREYHLIKPAHTWMETPKTALVLPQTDRILTLGASMTHNRAFIERGWTDARPYEFLRNALDINSNVLWQIPQYELYSGRPMRRTSYYNDLLYRGISMNDTAATISAFSKQLLDSASVRTIISTLPITSDGLSLTHEYSDNNITIGTYDNPGALERVYLTTTVAVAKTVEDVQKILETYQSPPDRAIIEQEIAIQSSGQKGTATITNTSDTSMTIGVTDSPGDSLLVITDTYYPGWKAAVDEKEVAVLPVNIRFRGILVPKGSHTIRMWYKPESVRLGSVISAIGVGLWIILMAFPLVSVISQTQKKAHQRAAPRFYSRDRFRLRNK